MAANIAWIRKSEESRLLFEGEAARCRLSLDGLVFDLLEDNRQKHFEALFTVHRMRMFGRHDDGFAFFNEVRLSVNREPSGTFKNRHHRVAAGLMRADFFSFIPNSRRLALGGPDLTQSRPIYSS